MDKTNFKVNLILFYKMGKLHVLWAANLTASECQKYDNYTVGYVLRNRKC